MTALDTRIPNAIKRLVPLLCAGAAIGVVLSAGGLMSDPTVRQAVKDRIITLDAHALHGLLRRVYEGQHLPHFPAGVPVQEVTAYDWLGSEEFLPIAHGLGPSLHAGENTLETLDAGLALGFRVFEVDLTLTSDDRLVCFHGPDDEATLDRLTYANYLAIVRDRGMRPCEFSNLVAVARGHKAIRFVLDVKNRFEDAYRIARAEIGDSATGRSFIPQIYFFEQIPVVRSEPQLAGEIFTSYRSALTNEQIFRTARHAGVRVVTLTLKRFDDLHGHLPSDLYVLVHPVDDPFVAADIRTAGARGIYTSYLTSKTVPDLFRRWPISCKPPAVVRCHVVADARELSPPVDQGPARR